MGYTHYWYRPEEISKEAFRKIAGDVHLVTSRLEQCGIPIAGWDGTGEPEINPETISFNGNENCGHPRRDLGITWPAGTGDEKSHEGATLLEELTGNSNDIETEGYKKWFAGALLKHRECGGDCSHESFTFPRTMEVPDYMRTGNPQGSDQASDGSALWFNCTKTAFKPYDLAVTAALIICKHYCPDIQVHSDGEDEHWQDAKVVCMEWLGYGENFKLDRDD